MSNNHTQWVNSVFNKYERLVISKYLNGTEFPNSRNGFMYKYNESRNYLAYSQPNTANKSTRNKIISNLNRISVNINKIKEKEKLRKTENKKKQQNLTKQKNNRKLNITSQLNQCKNLYGINTANRIRTIFLKDNPKYEENDMYKSKFKLAKVKALQYKFNKEYSNSSLRPKTVSFE